MGRPEEQADGEAGDLFVHLRNEEAAQRSGGLQDVCVGGGGPVGRERGGALEDEDGVEVRGDGGAQMELRSAHRDGDPGGVAERCGAAVAMGLAKISASVRRR